MRERRGHGRERRSPGWGGRPEGFGPFFEGRPWGEGGPWGHMQGGRGRGRARRGDVRAAILALLKDRSMHGYEMIQEIEQRSGGAWKPSPGSVYPTLQLLEDEGLISSEAEGSKKLFGLTDAGRAEADAGPEAPWEEAGRSIDWDALNDIRKAGGGLFEAFRQVWANGTPEQREQALAIVNKARKDLYLILANDDD